MWKRVKLSFAPGLWVEFVNRDRALRQIEELAKRGTRFPIVIYGPEGCGKTALFKQAFEILRSYDYSVVYVSPLAQEESERLVTTEDVRDVVISMVRLVAGESIARVVDLAIEIATKALRRNKRIAILADDIFQAVGLDKAEIYVKKLLNAIEYPSEEYEKIVVLVGSSEGITRERVGRHSWANLRMMWNMTKEGLRALYDQIPGEKPPFEEVWRWTGGNPRYLSKLYEAGWSVDRVVKDIIVERRSLPILAKRWRSELEHAVEDPDYLWEEYPKTEGLTRELVKHNLIVEMVYYRDEYLWIDVPPPERDVELGIGKYFAWTTPLHREAVRQVLREVT